MVLFRKAIKKEIMTEKKRDDYTKLLDHTVYVSLIYYGSQVAQWVKVFAASNLMTEFHLQSSQWKQRPSY